MGAERTDLFARRTRQQQAEAALDGREAGVKEAEAAAKRLERKARDAWTDVEALHEDAGARTGALLAVVPSIEEHLRG